MSLNNRQLMELAQELTGRTSAEVNAELQRRHLDAQTRIAIKLQLRTTAMAGTTMHATGHQEARPRSGMERLLDRVQIDRQHQYSEAELTELLQQTDLDAESRIAVRLECSSRGLLATSRHYANEAERLLEHLGIRGPVTLECIERQMDQAGYGPTLKTVIKSELASRGWLRAGRSMRASAATGTRLVDRRGRPLTLKSRL